MAEPSVDRARSLRMGRIRGRDTAPEILLRRALWASGLRYRVNYRTPHGRADIAFPFRRIAIYVDGCFWHGCPLHYVRPRSRADFWAEKLSENVARDRRQTGRLEDAGWTVLRFWEHQVHTSVDSLVAAIREAYSGVAVGAAEEWRVVAVEPLSDERERRTMELLRHPEVRRVREGRRTTSKW